MNDEVESLFEKVTPRGAPPVLRSRILSAMEQELSTVSDPSGAVPASDGRTGATVAIKTRDRVPGNVSWDRRIGSLVAAALVLGVMLNFWAIRTTENRLAELAGPRPLPHQVSDVIEIVESVTGRGSGEWVQVRLVEAWRSRPSIEPHRMPDWRHGIDDWEFNRNLELFEEFHRKAQRREKVEKVPVKKPDRAVFDDHDPVDRQRDLHRNPRQTC